MKEHTVRHMLHKEKLRVVESYKVSQLLLASAKSKPRSVDGYSHSQNILIVGDGDFSFTLSLATIIGGSRIITTSYDSKAEVLSKYPTARSTLASLISLGVQVYYSVDATRLRDEEFIEMSPLFHRVIFNFPHIGGAADEDVQANQVGHRRLLCFPLK